MEKIVVVVVDRQKSELQVKRRDGGGEILPPRRRREHGDAAHEGRNHAQYSHLSRRRYINNQFFFGEKNYANAQ